MHAARNNQDIADFDAVQLTVAPSKKILEWSYGEVLKPETINYRTQKPERDGLFCERIFGPVKDINPHDPKYKGTRARDIAKDKNGEIVTKSIVRRERMGHIQLAAPVAHIWFLRGTPSAIGLLMNMTVKNLEKVIYFASYIVISADAEKREQYLKDAEAELEAGKVAIKARYEKLVEADESSIKKLATDQSKEIQEVEATFLEKKAQLEMLVDLKLMTETDYRNLPDEYAQIVKVEMGADAIMQLLQKIDLEKLIDELGKESEETKGQRRKKIIKRLKMLEGMFRAGIKPESMIMTSLAVIPPDLRPMVQLTGGRFATSDLNDLYRRVINRNNRLKKLVNLKAPGVIKRNEMRMLQEAVDALIDNNNARSGRAVASTGGRRRLKSLSDMLKGKQGRFRQNLLGKRVDYSGRSVIVSGPELKIHQCGLPKMMALELFKPFVIGRLIDLDLAHNIKAASRMIERSESEVWDALDEVIKGKYVLLNRAPTLHRLGIQAFQPKLIEGKAIQLHPLVCKGFNADFDGDQMAVHLPLSREAQAEAEQLMSASHNLLKPADGSPVLHIEQDIVLGTYYMTFIPHKNEDKKEIGFSNIDEAVLAFDKTKIKLQDPIRLHVKGEVRKTTLGRALFNEVFPEDFPYKNETTTKKALQAIIAEVFEQYGEAQTALIADDLKDLGFEYATISGLSTAITDFNDPKNIDKMVADTDGQVAEISDQFDEGLITEDERYRLTVDAWKKTDGRILKQIEEDFETEDGSMAISIRSGARGNISNLKQITGSLGVVVDATGKEIELPIKSSYKEGFSPLEYFTSTRGARKGMISTALKTADSGYLTRRLVDVSQDVFTTDTEADDPGFEITRAESEARGTSFASRLGGRVAAEDIKVDGKVVVKANELIAPKLAKVIAEAVDSARIKSVLTTTSVRGIPTSSYGIDMATGLMVKPAEPVGVIAAQSIGEPGTQLTLDTFHSGGVAGEDISQGLPRVDELFEARNPKGQAYLSEISGVASLWEAGDDYVVQVVSDSEAVERLPLDGRVASIKNNTAVSKGDVVADSEGKKKPLIAPIEGIAEVFSDEIVIVGGDSQIKRYEIPGFKTMIIEDGQKVERGQRLTAGSINLQESLKLQGVLETQRYIMGEVQRIFASQGQSIADKHLEVVIRQMFSRVQIEDPGDSTFVIGDIVSRAAVTDKNILLNAEGKTPTEYTQLLLGITKVSTWSDSFLSAASFQNTTHVLINAATQGKVDELYGLKENVIIGRKIPVGTGARGRLLEPSDHQSLDEQTEI